MAAAGHSLLHALMPHKLEGSGFWQQVLFFSEIKAGAQPDHIRRRRNTVLTKVVIT
jgi:hypothetical protein